MSAKGKGRKTSRRAQGDEGAAGDPAGVDDVGLEGANVDGSTGDRPGVDLDAGNHDGANVDLEGANVDGDHSTDVDLGASNHDRANADLDRAGGELDALHADRDASTADGPGVARDASNHDRANVDLDGPGDLESNGHRDGASDDLESNGHRAGVDLESNGRHDGVDLDLEASMSNGDGDTTGDGADGEGVDGPLPELPSSAAAMDAGQLKQLVEALIFASDKPVTAQRLRQLTRVGEVRRLEQALAELAEDYRDRGLVLQQVSGGYQFRTRTQFSVWVQQLIAGRPVRLSRAQLETLAIVAYRQPITRPEIDDIRGVDSSQTLKLLHDRALVRVLGKKEEVGRPLLYGTTKEFLDFFSLGDLRELPTLREYSELTDESRRVISDRLGDEGAAEPVADDSDAPASEIEEVRSLQDDLRAYVDADDDVHDPAHSSTNGVDHDDRAHVGASVDGDHAANGDHDDRDVSAEASSQTDVHGADDRVRSTMNRIDHDDRAHVNGDHDDRSTNGVDHDERAHVGAGVDDRRAASGDHDDRDVSAETSDVHGADGADDDPSTNGVAHDDRAHVGGGDADEDRAHVGSGDADEDRVHVGGGHADEDRAHLGGGHVDEARVSAIDSPATVDHDDHDISAETSGQAALDAPGHDDVPIDDEIQLHASLNDPRVIGYAAGSVDLDSLEAISDEPSDVDALAEAAVDELGGTDTSGGGPNVDPVASAPDSDERSRGS